jgi:hypothetical protein
MKSLDKQIKFIDTKLLPLFGIKNVIDYKTIIYLHEFDIKKDFLEKLNNIITEFKETFAVKNFNLHKTDYKIKSNSQAFNLLKKCLEITSIQHEIGIKKKKKYLRLISENNILNKYIKTMNSSEIRVNGGKIDDESANIKLLNKDLVDNIKKVETSNIILKCKYLDCRHDKIKIDLKHYNLDNKNIKSLKINILSEKENDINILSESFINKNFKNAKYKICFDDDKNKFIYHDQICSATEYIPKDVILLNSQISCSECAMYIESIENLDNMAKYLVFELIITHVEFNKEFQRKLTKASVYQIIYNNNLANIYCVSSSQGYLKFDSYIELEKVNKYIENIKEPSICPCRVYNNIGLNKEETFKQQNIIGTDIMVGKLNAFYHTCNPDTYGSSKMLIPLVVTPSYDLSIGESQPVIPLMDKYHATKKTDIYEHCLMYSVRKGCDLINKLTFTFTKPININKLSIIFSLFGTYMELIKIESIKLNETTYQSAASIFYNIAGSPYASCLQFVYNGPYEDNPFENLTFQCTDIYIPQTPRSDLFTSRAVFTLNQLEDLFGL